MRSFSLSLIIVVLVGCSIKVENGFTKLDSNDTGITFNNINVENDQINIFTYEYLYNGGGVAAGDINNDGLPDLYFTSNNLENKLYLNKGDFKFEDITTQSGAGCLQGWKTGVSMVDINADGWLDIYVCRSADGNPERRRNSLLINNGDLTFTDKAIEYGLADESYTTQAAFFDYDRDGDLDVFLLNHSLLQISNSFNISSINRVARYPHVGNKLLRNDNGKFVDVSDDAGIYGPSSNYGLGIGISDFNSDGWPDIYVSNDYVDSDKLFLNDQNGKFLTSTDSLLSQISQFSMGLDIGDVNRDGHMDIITLDMLPEDNRRQKLLFGPENYFVHASMKKNGYSSQCMRNMLHLNNGNGSFSEIGQIAGVSNTDWSWSALFADFDNDGFQDLFISNGYKRDFTNNDFLKFKADQEIKAGGAGLDNTEMIERMPSSKQANYVFRHTGSHGFDNVGRKWGFDEEILTHGAVYADLDNDGDLDMAMNNMDAPASIYRNDLDKDKLKNFLKIKLVGGDQNRSAIGSRVTVFSNGEKLTREQFPVRGFQSSIDEVLHFGLDSVAQVDSIHVVWPTGGIQRIMKMGANQLITVTETAESSIEQSSLSLPTPHFEKIDFTEIRHRENEFVDFKTQALLPRMYSYEGPALVMGDVNGDALKDLFIGGSKGYPAQLLIRDEEGNFSGSSVSFEGDSQFEDVDALFFDANNDGLADLYVVSGGYEFSSSDALLQDRLYMNTGGGNLVISEDRLPQMLTSGSSVRPVDIDKDGDIDLFVGGRIVPGRYPEVPNSYLLENDGQGYFKDVTSTVAADLGQIGMVTDAKWADVNGDSDIDLIVVGEWMGIKIFLNKNGKLIDQSAEFLDSDFSGWWNSIEVSDIDGDGDIDFLAGNHGLNNQMRPTPQQPVTMLYEDFDGNGSVDPVLFYYIQGQSYPYASRDELLEQIPTLKKRFLDYESYSSAQLEDILTAEQVESSNKLTATTFETALFLNQSNQGFIKRSLPVQAQFAPVNSIALMDVNGDNILDIIMGGNFEKTRVRTGMYTGNNGFVFLGDGNGTFTYLDQTSSGLRITGTVKKILIDENRVLFGRNNENVSVYEVSNSSD